MQHLDRSQENYENYVKWKKASTKRLYMIRMHSHNILKMRKV